MHSGRKTLRMADVCRLSGVSDQTIRFYERKGLISPVGRTPKGHRIYAPESLQTIRIIKVAQSMGFCLDEIQTMLHADKRAPGTCQELQALLQEEMRQVHALEEALGALKTKLGDLMEDCLGCEGKGCPLRSDIADQAGIPGERLCICLGGEPQTLRNTTTGTQRYAS